MAAVKGFIVADDHLEQTPAQRTAAWKAAQAGNSDFTRHSVTSEPGSAGGGSKPPSSSGSRSGAMGMASFAVTIINTYGAYQMGQIKNRMLNENIRHDKSMATIQLKLNQFLSGVQLNQIEKASSAEAMSIQIGRMRAQSAAITQGAGSGNESGQRRIQRQFGASAANAELARLDELRGQRLNIATGMNNEVNQFISKTRRQPGSGPSPWTAVTAGATQLIGQAQGMANTE